jgi:hypothetical protein
MKKSFLAVAALMVSSIAFAQVDSTSQSAPSTDYSKTSPSDTVAQPGTPTDTVNNTGTQQDTLSNQGSGSSGAIQPKSDTTAATFTDEDLRKYAEVLDSVDAMKKELLAELTAKVKSNPKITVSRYMELAKAGEDQAKLAELKATPEEIAFVKEVTEYKNQEAAEISEKVKTLANDYVGIEAYSKIKNQLSWDSALEAKIAAIRAENKKPETASSKK